MSTPNFYVKNADAVYAFGGDFEDSIEYDFYQEYVVDQAIKKGFDSSSGHPAGNRSYGGGAFAEKTIYIDFCGESIPITIYLEIVSGYYSGASFDFSFKIDNEDYDLKDFGEYDAEGILESYLYDNLGLIAMQKKNLCKRINIELSRLSDEANLFFKEHCEIPLKCIGIFSNGEAIYEKMPA